MAIFKRIALFLPLFLFFLQPAYPVEVQEHEWSRPFMGTVFNITVYSYPEENAEQAVYRAFERIEELEERLSFYEEQSELNQLSRNAFSEAFIASPDLFAVLQAALHWSRQTHGAFDCTIRPLINLWHSRGGEGILPSRAEIGEARGLIGYKQVLLNTRLRSVRMTTSGMLLDLGGIAKGYSADKALESLEADGFSIVLIDAGGDLRMGDPPPGHPGWNITLENSGSGPSRLRMANGAIATSGDKYKYYEIDGISYSHIVNPRTGLGMTDHRQVTVMAEEGMTADALATALSVMDIKEGLNLINSLENTETLIRVNGTGEEIEGSHEKLRESGYVKIFRSQGFPALF
jgi:thiamine biosynthesis lipoprotein